MAEKGEDDGGEGEMEMEEESDGEERTEENPMMSGTVSGVCAGTLGKENDQSSIEVRRKLIPTFWSHSKP